MEKRNAVFELLRKKKERNGANGEEKAYKINDKTIGDAIDKLTLCILKN